MSINCRLLFFRKGEREMRVLEETIQKIERLDEEMMEKARERVDNLIKPPKSLGRLEDIAVQLSGITRNLYPAIDQKAIITMAADHGVFEEGISSNPQEVTFAQTLLFVDYWKSSLQKHKSEE